MEGPALKLYFFINWENSLRSAKLRKIREYTQCSVYQKRNPNGRILKIQWKRTTRSALCITAIISTIFYRIFTIIWWNRIKHRILFVQRYKWCKSNIYWLLSIFPLRQLRMEILHMEGRNNHAWKSDKSCISQFCMVATGLLTPDGNYQSFEYMRIYHCYVTQLSPFVTSFAKAAPKSSLP